MADSIDPGPLFMPLGEGNSGPGGHLRDTRPHYSEARLVADVVAMLGAIGIPTKPTFSARVAANAAADLLRALGIRPSHPPEVLAKTAPVNTVRCPRCGGMPLDGHMVHTRDDCAGEVS